MPKPTNFKTQPNLPELEELTLKYWQETKAFEKSVEMRPEDHAYVFYDGPPFATGMPHYGHLLASTTKDVIPRYWTMKGYRVNRVWGWDCHGLPIENMIEKKLEIKGGKKGIEQLGIAKFNQACRTEVMRLDTEWEKIIGRLGRWVDFKNNYKTMDRTFMESVWWGFKQLHDQGLVYEGKRVILYCPRCSTPLSNFEIAMDNSYVDTIEPSNVYKYPVKGQANTFLLAWSTTPWNKLATPALAVNPDLTYVKVRQGEEFYILAETTLKILNQEPAFEILEKMIGKDLEKLEFELHFDFYPNRITGERAGVVVADDFVTAEEGTGVVTLAAYGEDDYRVMQKHQIQLVEHVDEEGKLRPEVKPWAGMNILAVNPLVNEDLAKRGLVYREFPHTHSVAACYRCSTRLYYAPVPAWFINIQKIKEKLIAENEKINWFPKHLKHGRFKKGLESAPDWNISRSRYWGTPMPVWQSNGQQRIIGSLEELKKWAVEPSQVEQLTDIHPEFINDLEVWVDDNRTIKGKRISEVFDCWIESGSMPFASIHYPFSNKDFFDRNYPAQFVSEYIAQTRAWFYTMHVMSVGIFGKPPFENVLTTGTILAEDGSKMSKSKKNYPDPMVLINKYGVDSLRLYLMSSTVMKGENLNFSEKEVADLRRKVFIIWWNVLSFFQQFADLKQVKAAPDYEPQHVMDKWLLSRVNHLIKDVTTYMDAYDVIRTSRSLINFVDELSTWYLRLSRDRFRVADNHEPSQILGYALLTLAQLFAPITPFFSETVYHTLIDQSENGGSVHHSDWPIANELAIYLTLEQKMEEIKQVVELVRAQRTEVGIKLRQPLASLTVKSSVEAPQPNLLAVLAQEVNVKKIDWQQAETLSIELDQQLTPELIAEGEARELIRTIQGMRKEAGLEVDQTATVELPGWPAEFQAMIEQKTKTQLIKGETAKLIS